MRVSCRVIGSRRTLALMGEDMQDNESVLLTAEGKDVKVELTETLVRVTIYNKSKIERVREIPKDSVIKSSISKDEFRIYFPDASNPKKESYFRIYFKSGQMENFEKMAKEFGQGFWYEDKSKLSHIESYESEEKASLDADKAAKSGWKAVGSSATDGHINIGRTLARGLIFGAHRTKGKITITYERTPEWLASNNKAASSSSVPIQTANPQPADDPLHKMKKLKEMLDAGLISESEYNAKKADLLSKM
jgi:hypothetical protein